MRVLITGINGFIGQHLVKVLTERGHQVFGLGRDRGGVLDKKSVERAVRNVETVVHLAALTSHEEIVGNKFETLETNLRGTKNVLDAFSKSRKARKFLFASTGKVYGKIIRLPIDEEHSTHPLNILGKSKLITERLIDFYASTSLPSTKLGASSASSKEFIIFRIFNVYGTGQRESFLIPTILSQVNSGKKEIKLGDIKAKRDHVYIDDVIDAFIRAIEKKLPKGLSIYNICTGTGSSARNIVDMIETIKREKIKVKVNKNLLRHDEMDNEYGSFQKAKKAFGWEPNITLRVGLRKLLTPHRQAIILAGGKGTRIQSVSTTVPKILFPFNKKPLLDYLIDHLKKNEFNDVVICTGYLADKVENYIARANYGIKIRVSKENMPLGTAGALHLIKDLLEDEFFVLFGDVYTTINLQKMLKFHKKKKADVTLAIHTSDHPGDSTIVQINSNKRVQKFIEKPGNDWKQYGNLTATSLYVMKKSVLQFITKKRAVDFARDVFPKMVKNRKRIFGYLTSEYAKDMGTPERYKKVEKYIMLNSR